MKLKTLLSFLILLVISTKIFSADFRGSSWGDTPEDVIKQEKSDPVKVGEISTGKKVVLYHTTVSKVRMTALYTFDNNSLYEGMYMNIGEYKDKLRFMLDYLTMAEPLTKKYGKPIISNMSYKGKTIGPDKLLNWSEELEKGNLSMVMNWDTETTRITNQVSVQHGEVIHVISYREKVSLQERREEAEADAKAEAEAAAAEILNQL
jgi:hypothetical protein